MSSILDPIPEPSFVYAPLRWTLFVGLLLAFILVPFVLFEGKINSLVQHTFQSGASWTATQEEAFKRDALLRQYLGSPDNPEFNLWCVKPTRVRFMREWALDYYEVPVN